jgi:uncharacterized protein YdhG (YjbR/CyaY superfamily)
LLGCHLKEYICHAQFVFDKNLIMISKKGLPKPKTINDYINAAPGDAHEKLLQMLACIRAAAPGAKEGLKWGMPAFSYKRILVTFAVFKHHIGFYSTPSAVKAFAKDLSKFKTGEGSIQFPLDKPLPLSLIRKITLFRVKESLEEDKKWRT